MSENQKKPSFSEKLKNTKVNRASVITAVVLVLAVAVIITATVLSDRAKPKLPDETQKPVSTDASTTPPPKDTSTQTDAVTDSKPTGGSSVTESKVPTLTLPVSGTLSAKHDPELQVYSTTLDHYRVHLGIDISTGEAAPVYAAADGTVEKIWKDDLWGYSLAIKHSGNSYTFYKNLSEELPAGITEGTKVRSGQLIAAVGDSAMMEIAEEPHLHFEMTVADLAVDPLSYFSESALKSLNVNNSED